MRVLLELRPALDGHAGIPQETRLLFRGLSQIDDLEVQGLLQSSTQLLAKGLSSNAEEVWSEDRKINRLSRVVVSLHRATKVSLGKRVVAACVLAVRTLQMIAGTLLGMKTPLGRFYPTHFEDFIWREIFAKTLASDDFKAVTTSVYRVARVPWSAMHWAALAVRRLGHAVYPRLETDGIDVMIAQTPYPGRVGKRTTLVVRYHDAFPLLMPHTISDKSYHQASHYHALRRNVADGAWFCCVSDATRRDLLSVFPEAKARVLTIHNMISRHYFAEDSSPARVAEIVNTRRNTSIRGVTARSLSSSAGPPNYLLMVSTIEPRKNHLTLLSGWEQLRTEFMPGLQLVLVGSLGWDHKSIVRKFKPWLERGGLHMLQDVPSAELRLLYRHARVTVCPSYGEGFDFSGVEAMCCGGVVAASDIPVHRDIFGGACELFSPYSASDLAKCIQGLLDPAAAPRRAELVEQGARVSAQYLPERILPQWSEFLRSVKA